MDPSTSKLWLGSAGARERVYIEDVFSTWLFTANGSTQTITNGIDLSGKGGMVWQKARDFTGGIHYLIDTARGSDKVVFSNLTDPQATASNVITSFNSNGFSLGNDSSLGYVNFQTGKLCASWTFRKQAKFFDVVTWTGSGANRTIAHSLGSVPGCIIVKRTDTTADWQVYHRSLANTEYLVLNSTAAKATGATRWNSTTPTSTEFSLGTDATVNASGGTYVAYLFAHDAGGFGISGSDNVVSCGSFTMASGDVTVSLGYEPQWLLIKSSTGNAEWGLYDVMRGLDYTNPVRVTANTSDAEAAIGGNFLRPTPTGFVANSGWFGSSGTFIYVAIRRGPMKTPTDATKVFHVTSTSAATGTQVTTNFTPDTQIASYLVSPGSDVMSRLTSVSSNDTDAGRKLITAFTGAEGVSNNTRYWSNIGYKISSYFGGVSTAYYTFGRAPGFFDTVAYTGNGTTLTLSHNLAVAPELIILKRRDTTANWVLGTSFGASNFMLANPNLTLQGFLVSYDPAQRFTAQPTSSVFSVGAQSDSNANASTYIAYLFASCPGVSKVGSYTGTGTTLNIDCGFTAGARFVLIKRADSTGDWYVWDTARGISATNDPYILFNSQAAEVTGTDYIDPLSSGFQISSTAPAAINANGGSFIFLAVA